MKIYNYIEVQQPIGTFYMCSIPAELLVNIVVSRAYKDGNAGVQRELAPERTNAVMSYCSDPDAVFPTPIVISVDKDAPVDIDEKEHKIIIRDENKTIGEVIDGQHRLWGIKKSELISQFYLPVVLMFDLTVEEKAYVFATINSNQKKVDTSLIYELFDVSEVRSPQRTAHQLARVMNYNEESPLRGRLKMLGKKVNGQENAVLSQGTFAKSILMLISRNVSDDALKSRRGEQLTPINGYLFRDLYIAGKDDVIAKILLNCFNALKEVFLKEWESPTENILWKTTGFRAVIYSLKSIMNKGRREKTLTKDYFIRCFEAFHKRLQEMKLTLTSESFPGGGEQSQKKLAAIILEAMIKLDEDDYHKHLNNTLDFQSFLDNTDELDIHDIYDLAQILENGLSVYDRFKVLKTNDTMEVIYPFTDASITLTKQTAKDFLRYIERKYMDDMDSDSWYGYIQSVSKDD